MKLVALTLVVAIAAVAATPAFAGQCDEDVAKIDEALVSAELSGDDRAQLEDMRNQAVQLCGAGNEAEGLDVTSEAKSMLQIE
jgi:hypothetical protein